MALRKLNTAFTKVFQIGTAGLSLNCQISKNGAALANPAGGVLTLSDLTRGLYYGAFGTDDADTAGELGFAVTDAATNTTIYPVEPDQVTAPVAADVVAIGGDTQSATDLKDFADTGYDPASHFAIANVVYWAGLTASYNSAPIVNVGFWGGSTASTVYGKSPIALVVGQADSGTTTTMVDAALNQSDDDYWKGAWIRFTNGVIEGQVRPITGFNAASDTITFSPATTQAVSTQTYEIIPGIDPGDNIFARVIDGSLTFQQMLMAVQAMLTGPETNDGTTFVFKNPGETKDRVTIVTDANNQRLTVSFDFS